MANGGIMGQTPDLSNYATKDYVQEQIQANVPSGFPNNPYTKIYGNTLSWSGTGSHTVTANFSVPAYTRELFIAYKNISLKKTGGSDNTYIEHNLQNYSGIDVAILTGRFIDFNTEDFDNYSIPFMSATITNMSSYLNLFQANWLGKFTGNTLVYNVEQSIPSFTHFPSYNEPIAMKYTFSLSKNSYLNTAFSVDLEIWAK